MGIGQVIISLAALFATLVAIGILMALLNRPLLQRQVTQVQRRLIPPGLAYRRYLGSWLLLRLGFAFIALICIVISFLVISSTSMTPADPFPLSLRIYIVGLLPIFWIALLVYMSVAETTNIEAMHLVGRNVTRGGALAFRWKSFLPTLPLVLMVECILAVVALDVPIWLLIAVPLLLAMMWILTAARFRYIYPAQALEQTEWAPFAPRIRDWARLAKFSYKETRITRSDSFGFIDGNVSGIFRRTLYLSDGLLRNTDWRQQDAFVAFLFALSRRRRLISLSSLGISLPTLAIVAGFFYLQITNPDSLLLSLLLPLAILLILLISIGFRIFLRVYLQTGNNRLPFYADRRAAELTGDPLAIMVLLNTINQISGGMLGVVNSLAPASGTTLLPQRMICLDALIRAPGPRAPWAYQPVPAMAPVFFGPYPLTVPYQPSTPPPVPTTRYPITAAPAPAAPMPMALMMAQAMKPVPPMMSPTMPPTMPPPTGV